VGPDVANVAVVGAGAFGLTAALELRRRGHSVVVVDPGPVPHPLAASTDASKAVRMDYGADALYAELGARAIDGWHAWNARWGTTLYHEVGFLLATSAPMAPGGYEHAGFGLLGRLGRTVERLGSAERARRFPAWARDGWPDGYLNPRGGWVESGRAIERLAADARAAGVAFETGAAVTRVDAGAGAGASAAAAEGGGVTLERAGADAVRAATVVVAAGAWTPWLLPHTAGALRSTAQCIVHFRPDDPEPFRGARFPVWGADIARTGWYGFPLDRDGTVKVANHGPGRALHPDERGDVRPSFVERCRAFLRTALPALADAEVVRSRVCFYCDAFDGHFWIGRDPDRPGLVVASGGSGHAFKFAPVLGEIVADVVEGRPDPYGGRFAWRPVAGGGGTEAARHAGDPS